MDRIHFTIPWASNSSSFLHPSKTCTGLSSAPQPWPRSTNLPFEASECKVRPLHSSSRKRDWIRKVSAKQNLAFRSFSRFKVFVPWGPPAFPCRTSCKASTKTGTGGATMPNRMSGLLTAAWCLLVFECSSKWLFWRDLHVRKSAWKSR